MNKIKHAILNLLLLGRNSIICGNKILSYHISWSPKSCCHVLPILALTSCFTRRNEKEKEKKKPLRSRDKLLSTEERKPELSTQKSLRRPMVRKIEHGGELPEAHKAAALCTEDE